MRKGEVIIDKDNGNLPAFGHGDHTHGGSPGLTKREWRTGMALQGLCANSHAWEEQSLHSVVRLAVEHADTTLKELEQTKTPEG